MVTFKLDNIQEISLLIDNYCLVNDSIEKFIAEDTFNRSLNKSLYDDMNKTKE